MSDFLNKEVKKPLIYQARKFLPISLGYAYRKWGWEAENACFE